MSSSSSRARYFRWLRFLAGRARAGALVLVALGFLLRVWAAFAVPPDRFHGDEPFYWQRSQAILETGDPGTAWQPPAFSYAVAVARYLGPGTRESVRWINPVAGLAAAAALIALAASWSRALVPLAVMALHPVWIGHAAFVLSENVFLALLLAALAFQEQKGTRCAAVAGLLWGLAALTRQIALPFFALAVLVRWRSGGAGHLATATLLVVFTATVAPWLVRNAQVEGRAVFTTSSGFNLWAGNQDEVRPAYSWQSHRLGDYYTRYLDFAEAELERDDEARRRALRFIAEAQPDWLWRKPWMGVTHLLEPDNYVLRRVRLEHYGPLQTSSRRAIGFLTLVGEFAVLAWAVWTMLALRPAPRRTLVLAMILVGAAIQIVTVGNARHRLMLELLVLCTAGLRFRPPARWRVAAALGVAAALAGVGLVSPGRQELLEVFAGR
jgi:hypothetical protein